MTLPQFTPFLPLSTPFKWNYGTEPSGVVFSEENGEGKLWELKSRLHALHSRNACTMTDVASSIDFYSASYCEDDERRREVLLLLKPYEIARYNRQTTYHQSKLHTTVQSNSIYLLSYNDLFVFVDLMHLIHMAGD